MHERLAHIDGLRAVAALLVLYQHGIEHWAAAVGGAGWVGLHLAWLFTWIDLGKVGVVAFFAISGFVVPLSFRGDRPRTQFLLSRLLRLFPAYWVAVLLATWVLAAPLPQAVANLGMVPALFGQTDLLGVFWTLRIEWIFYALCLLLFSLGIIGSAWRVFQLAMLLLAAAVAGAWLRSAGFAAAPVSLPLYLAVMLFGHLARLAVNGGDASARRAWAWLLAPLCLVIPLAWATAFDDGSHKESVLSACSGFMAGLALFGACVWRRWFSAGWLVHLGRISYGIYLFHPIALALLLASWQGGLFTGDSLALRAALSVLATLLLAQLVFSAVERPAIRLGRLALRGAPSPARERSA